MKKIFVYLCLVSLLTACSTPHPTQKQSHKPTNDKAKNIILLIGDGMGLGQITAGMYANGNKTALENFPVIGLHKSHAGNKLITDSAAGATAFASGVKTYNGAIGVDMDTTAIPTILEEAESIGKATGLIASCNIGHATPASFFAHDPYRKNYEAIAADMLDCEVDYFVGGGLSYFSSRESDDRNLISELQEKSYEIKTFLDQDFEDITINTDKNFGYFTANKEPLPAAQGRYYLLPATKAALPFLKTHSENGFFLMVEGSQIDWGGHANNQDYIITEFIDFDAVIGHVLDWAQKDGQTLVIVTADHETGGFAIQKESTMDSLVTAFTSDYHTATMIPVFAYGPGAESFAGIYENTAIYHKMKKAFGLTREQKN